MLFLSGECGTFPECVARVPVSHGGLGAEGVFARRCVLFATVRNRPQPFATARSRPQPSARSPYGRVALSALRCGRQGVLVSVLVYVGFVAPLRRRAPCNAN